MQVIFSVKNAFVGVLVIFLLGALLSSCDSIADNEKESANVLSNELDLKSEDEYYSLTAAAESPCTSCHGQQGFAALPDDHEGRSDDMCLSCHGVDSYDDSLVGNAIPHSLAS